MSEKAGDSVVRVGVIGFGTVGAGVAGLLLRNGGLIEGRTGLRLELAKVADLDITTDRGVSVPAGVLTTDVREALGCDIVAELIGGTTKAGDFILEALGRGRPVVTANKALLACRGAELFAAAEKAGADIFYEASVAGGIPVIKALREGLVGNRVDKIYGILNGTCNYILTRMEREGVGFGPVLADAQRLGYAEAEPSLDIDGHDTAHKAAILASLAYGEWFGAGAVHTEGIRGLPLEDLRYADELGYRVKLLAIIKQGSSGDVEARVHPTLLPKKSMLAGISEVFNGVMVSGDAVGDTLFYGRGAGRDATSSAVVADIVDAALNLRCGCRGRVAAFRPARSFGRLLPMDETVSRHYMRLQVEDRPGVIAKVADSLARHDISISSMIQKEGQSPDNVGLLILTHKAVEKSVRAAVAEMEKMSVLRDKVRTIRIEDI